MRIITPRMHSRCAVWTRRSRSVCSNEALFDSRTAATARRLGRRWSLQSTTRRALAFTLTADRAAGCSAAETLAAALARKRFPLWVLGALWGLVTVVRWQDGVFGLVLVPRLLSALRGQSFPRALRVVLEFGIAAAFVMLPQFLFWQAVYGRPLVLTKPGFMHWGQPQVGPLLFSIWQGAFVWCPLLLAGFVGLALLPRRNLRWALWAGVALEIYLSAVSNDWWGSISFGPRRLVATAPIAGLGLALVVARLSSRARVTALALLHDTDACPVDLRDMAWNFRGNYLACMNYVNMVIALI